jgi:hypothetical protein
VAAWKALVPIDECERDEVVSEVGVEENEVEDGWDNGNDKELIADVVLLLMEAKEDRLVSFDRIDSSLLLLSVNPVLDSKLAVDSEAVAAIVDVSLALSSDPLEDSDRASFANSQMPLE